MSLIASFLALAQWIFADAPGDVQVEGSPAQWSWGVPLSGPGGVDPMWATNLEGTYLNEADDSLVVALPDGLDVVGRPALVVRHWYDVRVGDAASIEVDRGDGFEPIEPFYGYPAADGFVGRSEGWVDSAWDLSDLRDVRRARLRFRSDAAVSGAGWYVAEIRVVDGDAVLPSIKPLVVPMDSDDPTTGQAVVVEVTDDLGVLAVDLVVTIDGEVVRVPMVAAGATWSAELPAAPIGAEIAWHVEAADDCGVARFPPTEDGVVRIALPVPGLPVQVDPSPRNVAQAVEITWEAPRSRSPVIGYRVFGPAGEVLVDAPPALVTLDPDLSPDVSVAARYAEGESAPAGPVAVDVEVPALDGLEPNVGWPGDRIWVHARTRSLYLLDGVTQAAMSGAVVERVEVLHADEARLAVRVVDGAEPGPRTLILSGAQGTATFEGVFTVAPEDERPRVLSVTPDTVRQGESATIVVTASSAFSARPEVGADSDLVASLIAWDGASATLTVAASPSSPVGGHTLVLDDGDRLWTVPVTVARWTPRDSAGCDTSGAGTGGALLALFLLRRAGGRRSAR